MNREKTIRFLRQICTQYDVKVIFKAKLHKDIDGEADTKNEVIFINKNLSRKCMAEAVFHELGHIYCVRKGKWKKFHEDNDYSAIKSFRAENWVEHWAKREWDAWGMRKMFGQYRFTYLKSEQKHLIKWIQAYFKVPKIR